MTGKKLIMVLVGLSACVSLIVISSANWKWRKLDAHVSEIGASFETIFSVSCLSNDVFYAYNGLSGRTLRRRTLITGKAEDIKVGKPVMRLLSPSPDDRCLLLKAVTLAGSESPTEWLIAVDSVTQSITVITQMFSIGRYPCWLNERAFIFVGRFSEKLQATDPTFHVEIKDGVYTRNLSFVYPHAARFIHNASQILIPFGNEELAFCQDGEIFKLDLKSSTLDKISDFGEALSDLEWLRFSHGNGWFLFCSTKKGENFRNLFKFNPITKEVRTLTSEHTYNGQWLSGDGYAFIENRSNAFCLALRPTDHAKSTNLFAQGFVERYSVSSDGTKVYIVASTNAEPRSLWLYDIERRELSLLEPGNKRPFRISKVSVPIEQNMVSFDGLQIPTYLFPPIGYKKDTQYPLVVYLPPQTAQCSRGYELQAQLIANLGCFYLGINYRGTDGYGHKYSALWNADDAARDVLFITRTMIKDPRIDKRHIFFVSMSSSSIILRSALTMDPNLPKAVVFGSPAPFSLPLSFSLDAVPPMLLTMGRADPSLHFAQTFENWVKTTPISARVHYIDSLGHADTPDATGRIEQERETAKFLLNQLRR